MLPYGRQWIEEDDIEAVVASLRSDWLTQGPAVERFERGLAEVCQVTHAIACNSGTAALHMAYEALGIGPGSLVVVPANTFLATANAAVYLGAKVRFADVDPVTGLMTVETLAKVLDETVDLVVPVHFAGQSCEMQAIAQLVRQRCPRARIVEDASHALGAIDELGLPVGSCSYADAATFSFHPVKHIAAGEGGAVVTRDAAITERTRRFRCHGMTKDPLQMQRPQEGAWYYEMHQPGMNYRIPDLSCALAGSQLAKLDRFVERRREIASTYLQALKGLEHVVLPPEQHLRTSAWHLFCLHIDFPKLGLTRGEYMEALKHRGVGTQVHYYPVPLQPYYESLGNSPQALFVGAIEHYERALSIPMFPAMTDAHVSHVINAVREVSQCSYRRAAS